MIQVEARGLNSTGASYETCINANTAADSQGTLASTAFANIAFNKTAERLNGFLQGLTLASGTDVIGLLEMCAYEVSHFFFFFLVSFYIDSLLIFV